MSDPFTLQLRVWKVIGEFFETSGYSEELNEDTHFIDDLGADRIDLADLCEELQDEFQIEIGELDMEGMYSINPAFEASLNANSESAEHG